MIKRPMLACSENLTLDRLGEITYPKWVTPKLDGIRCTLQIVPEQRGIRPLSRKLKLLPNCHLFEWADTHGVAGMDGEIVIPGLGFNDIQSWVMTEINHVVDFKYMIFDHTGYKNRTYLQRLQVAKRLQERYAIPNVEILEPIQVDSPTELEVLFHHVLGQGHEGLIVRDGEAPYKENRATWLEQSMLKMKAFEDAEAKVIGFEPEYENRNEKKKDETGLSKRSSHKAGLHARERLGKFVVEDATGRQFSIGSGLSQDQKKEIWEDRRRYLGAIVTYKYHVTGGKDKPRTPIFKGIRLD